jgi:DNA polymerase-1
MRSLIDDNNDYDLIIIDFANQVARCLYGAFALSYNGIKTGALMGVCRTYFNLHNEFPNAKIIYCLEGGNNRRKDLYNQYKANRSKNDDFIMSLKLCMKFIKYVDCDYLSIPTTEADDVAFYLIANRPKGKRVLLISSDQDWLGMVTKNYVDIQKSDMIEDYKRVYERLGYPPEHISIVKILTGDASDNVKGITRFPTAAAIELAKNCKSYKDIKNYPLHKHNTSWTKWEDRIKEEWHIVERNYEVLGFHPEWCRKEDIVRKQGHFDKAKVKKLLLDNGIVSLVNTYIGD